MARAALSELTALRNGLTFTISDDDFVKKAAYWFVFEDTRKTNWSFRIEGGSRYLCAEDVLKDLFCVAITARNLDNDDSPAICTLYVMASDNVRALFINGKFNLADVVYSTQVEKGQKITLPASVSGRRQ